MLADGGRASLQHSEDLRRLHHLLARRSFGLSLHEINGVLDADVHRDPADLLRRHFAVLDERIRRSIELRLRLRAVLGALDGSVEPSTTHLWRDRGVRARTPG